jgi:hypothetical protein
VRLSISNGSIREASDVPTVRPDDSATTNVLQLVEAAGIRTACEFDVLLFFSRHPRVVLSDEQLATYVGHEIHQVARALELLLSAGLLNLVRNPSASTAMYVLAVERVEQWLEPVRRLCATPDGRHALRTSLKARRSPSRAMNGSVEHA